jgi:hypothetical protein
MAKRKGVSVSRIFFGDEGPPFEGALEFDLEIAMLGQRFIRRARIIYEFRGEWDWYDPKAGKVREGRETAVYHMELEAVPETQHKDDSKTRGEPYWVACEDLMDDDVLPSAAQEAIIAAIDKQCREIDAERRRAAGVA